MEDMELRFLQTDLAVETRAEGKPVISGYAAVFYDGTPGTEYDMALRGQVIERIHPGAFDKALASDFDFVGLFNHNADMPLGRRSAGTLRLSVDKRGLRYEIDPDPESRMAQDVVSAIRRGDIRGSSFQFRAGKDGQTWTQQRGVTIRELRSFDLLVDVGPTTMAAYSDADVSVARRCLGEFEASVGTPRLDRARRIQRLTEQQVAG